MGGRLQLLWRLRPPLGQLLDKQLLSKRCSSNLARIRWDRKFKPQTSISLAMSFKGPKVSRQALTSIRASQATWLNQCRGTSPNTNRHMAAPQATRCKGSLNLSLGYLLHPLGTSRTYMQRPNHSKLSRIKVADLSMINFTICGHRVKVTRRNSSSSLAIAIRLLQPLIKEDQAGLSVVMRTFTRNTSISQVIPRQPPLDLTNNKDLLRTTKLVSYRLY